MDVGGFQGAFMDDAFAVRLLVSTLPYVFHR